ncbi:hypothetical protein LU631_03945 [Erwinia tracheiphila]|uniref:DNA utilization protein HofO C-terminal domain-containing protein n=1 Tax=Erwinia tracheiphila TaxID=65700 RepID=A0A0M2KCR6_9GAMM|nr:hypothetical protein [Erwinia tracheiphila]AXF78028.1 hypothetical protein AV903_21730 [Erwinia tracheiphila]EOS95495.1 hypothetical protein ETR_08376 [Erwinia tracheiphila PSU-1]KKF37165.1 hypothetical protein SY86_19965 [Erwinia tracheiphila]UIA83258.1 hypothetical protein LU604_23420 [Erwinia tracheiphila]UIA88553.1 hypothetical protein LU631_03945 [Erwinia tracheiphila]
MNRNWLTDWLYFPLWGRVLTFSLCSLLLLGALWLCGLRPALEKARMLDSLQQKQSARMQVGLRDLLLQPPLLLLEAEITRLNTALLPTEKTALSLAALIMHSGGTIETWQPNNQGGEVTMRMQWQGFLSALGYLSGLSARMVLSGFTLTEKQGALLVKLSLVLNDDL